MAAMWQAHVNIWMAVVLSLAISLVLGAVNAGLILWLRIASLIVTLATDFIFGAVAYAIAGSSPPYGFPSSFTAIGQNSIEGVPYQLVIFAVAAAVVGFVVRRTLFGRDVVMIGFNRPAARYVGVRIRRTLLLSYMLSAFAAGVAGIVLGSFYGSVQPDIGDPLLLAAITVIVLGGVDIFGGEGRIGGVVIAVLVVGFLQQGLLIKGFPDLVETMATGGLLILAITLRIALRRKAG
jgi:ribose/xylose/arabinose/galactoside ABC-type transport system permease subunit